jgi:hypothetical protein
MSTGLEFNITARDQASKAVETINKKIKSFGADVAKSFLSFAAPLALMQSGIGFVTDKIAEYNARMEAAIDNASKLKDEAADLGVTVEVWQRLKGAADESGIAVGKVGKLYQEAVKMIEAGKDPLSDSARILRDALGFAGEDVAKGNIEAIDVIQRMGGALAGASSEADAMQLATALLGETMAKELLPALKEAAKLKEGFVDTEGLTDEEAAVLRAAKAEERRKKAREEFNDAKQAVSRTFLDTDPEGKKMAEEEFKKSGRGNWALSKDEDIQKRIAEILKKRAEDKKAADLAENSAAAARVRESAQAAEAKENEAFIAQHIAEMEAESNKDNAEAEADAQKAAEKAAAEKDKENKQAIADAAKEAEKERKAEEAASAKLTVSSLREIGGGLAGESFNPVLDIQTKALEVQLQVLKELQAINEKTAAGVTPSTNFTQ